MCTWSRELWASLWPRLMPLCSLSSSGVLRSFWELWASLWHLLCPCVACAPLGFFPLPLLAITTREPLPKKRSLYSGGPPELGGLKARKS